MESLLRDLRYAVVTMRRSVGLTATVLVTLALGIGTTTAVFSVIRGMLLRPLPYPEPNGLVRVWEDHTGGYLLFGNRWLSNRTRAAWIDSSQTLEAIGAYATYQMTVAFDPDDPIRMVGSELSPSVFRMLRATPALGRFFRDEEEREGANHVVVLSDELWRTRFNAAPDVLERTLTIEGDPHTIIGVARPGLEFPNRQVRFWVPNVIPKWASDPERTRVFSAIGRLRPGVTPSQAEAEGTAAARTVPRTLSMDLIFGKGGPVVVRVLPFATDMTARVRPALLVLASAVTLLLLIACANVANLFLSRGLARDREMVIRVAVGATRARLLRQLLVEGAVLSIAGGSIGLLLAWVLTRALPLLAPADLPRLEDVRIDTAVLAFSVMTSLFAALVSGLAPALRVSRFELYQSIRGSDGGSPSVRGFHPRRVRQGLLIVEAAFAVILVIGAGLLARSFIRLTNVDAGYTADHVLTARVHFPNVGPPDQTKQFLDAILPRLRATPGVTTAGAGNMMPMVLLTAITTFNISEWAAAGKPPTVRALSYQVTPGYGEALGLRLNEGRLLADGDWRVQPRPVLVNQEFVRQHIGRRPVVGLRLGALYRRDAGLETEIIGVVGNVLKNGNDMRPEPEIYFPLTTTADERPGGFTNIIVRTTGDPAAFADTMRALVRDLDRRIVIERIAPLTTLVSASVAQPRFGLTVVTVFAALALALAAVGLYGVLSYGVSQRRRELGVRAALGADRGRLIALVLREALAVSIVGAAIGLIAASALTRLMQTLLFGISPLDAVSYASGLVVLLIVALSAGFIPAWRAAMTDPAVALRE
jgi:putative ABC transport system permease protein